jgi:hypothetical protein
MSSSPWQVLHTLTSGSEGENHISAGAPNASSAASKMRKRSSSHISPVSNDDKKPSRYLRSVMVQDFISSTNTTSPAAS